MAAGDPGGAPLNPNDFTNGDHSWKNWVRVMWGVRYLQLFAIGFALLIAQLFNLGWCYDAYSNAADDGVLAIMLTSVGMFIPLTICCVIAYKGFYQFWQDQTHGISR